MSVAEVQLRIAEVTARFAPAAAAAPAFAPLLAAATRTSTPPAAAPAVRVASAGVPPGEGVVASAMEHLGTPYVWGGEDPGGFDCSGLVQYVFGKHGVDLPRVSRDQARAGRPVAVDDLRPGDLVFYGRPVDHVGIYAGNGKMVVAPRRGEVVRVQNVDFDLVTTARRVLPDGASPMTPLGPGPGVAAAGSGEVGRGLPAAAAPYAAAIERAARDAGIDPKLVAAVAWTESGFRADARSPAGAIGLMQLMPGTAAGLGVDPTDPVQNLLGGARYLAAQLERFGRLDLALAAYNAGPGAVAKHGGIPPYPETRAYVARVTERLQTL